MKRRPKNPFEYFEQELVDNLREQIPTAELHADYEQWCAARDFRPIGVRLFGKLIRKKFRHLSRHRMGKRGARFWVYEGIGWSSVREE